MISAEPWIRSAHKHRPQSAKRGVENRDQSDGPDAFDQRDFADQGILVIAEERVQRQAAREDHRDRGDKDEHAQQQERHDHARGGVVAIFQVLGDGENARSQEARQKEQGHDYQRDRGDPFIAGDGHARGARPRSGHAHELLSGDVGGDQRETDQRPGCRTAGQKVIGGIASPAAHEHRKADHEENKGEEED
jgi:hypothetical protein